MDDKFFNLPELAKPSIYNIHLKPCLKTFKFKGVSNILLDVIKKTNYLKLHAKELDILNISLELSNGQVFKNLSFELNDFWMLLTIKFPSEIEIQKNVKLNIEFIGELNDKMLGFSRSSYTDLDGNIKYIAYTQFESTYARFAFPCWDEPIYKAKFDIILEVDNNLTALSNMNIINEQKLEGGKKLLKYSTTPIMSSYLVAFAVGEFEYIQTKSNSGIDVRVYTVQGKKKKGKFALDLAAKCLDFFENFFGIPCELPKVDLISIPDFNMGAMENWGLITYREIKLLVDPDKSSTYTIANVALSVAHELTHFWFGNLVTMKWWTDLWLKEGLASFMEYYTISHLCPNFKIMLNFFKDEVENGFKLDSIQNSHPIEIEINNPNELNEIYDSITYSKSNCIVRMLYNYLGQIVFQKGLSNYLNKFKYSNAVTTDLWNALSDIAGQDIETMMSSWTKQMGYPLVTVEQKIKKNKRVIKLEQSRFLADGSKDKLNSIWLIPITIITKANPSEIKYKFLLKNFKEEIILDNIESDEWIKINSSISGFYRVQYSSDMLEKIVPAFQSKELSSIDRYGIISDLFALVKAAKTPATQFLSFFSACSNEDEYIVWYIIDQGISEISNVLIHYGDDKIKAQFDAFVCKIIEPIAIRLKWEPALSEDSQIGMLRGLILNRLSKCGHQQTIEIGLEKFKEHFNNNINLVPDLYSTIYNIAGRSNSAKEIACLQKIFETSGFSEIENYCIVAMAQCSDINLIKSIFEYGIDQKKIRSQDLFRLFYGLSFGTKIIQDFTLNYFKENSQTLINIFGSANSSIFQRILKISAQNQCSNNIANDFETYCKSSFDKHSLEILQRPINQVVEEIKLNELFLNKNIESIKKFLNLH